MHISQRVRTLAILLTLSLGMVTTFANYYSNTLCGCRPLHDYRTTCTDGSGNKEGLIEYPGTTLCWTSGTSYSTLFGGTLLCSYDWEFWYCDGTINPNSGGDYVNTTWGSSPACS